MQIVTAAGEVFQFFIRRFVDITCIGLDVSTHGNQHYQMPMMYELFLISIPMFLTLRLKPLTGETMADCELCGAMKVGVKQVPMGKTVVSACSRCVEKMGLAPKEVAPGLKIVQNRQTTAYTSKKMGKSIMTKNSKELSEDFSSIISKARKKRGWNHATLGKRMAETVNVIKSAENGKHPTDSVIKKFERVLGITLMVDSKPEETSRLYKDNSRGLTLGDYFNQNGE